MSPKRVRAGRGRNASLPFSLGPVLGACLLAIGNALRIEDAADNVITHTGKVAHASAANQNDGVLLQVMAFTGDVGRDFNAVGQPDARYLAERGVRLLGRHDLDLQ